MLIIDKMQCLAANHDLTVDAHEMSIAIKPPHRYSLCIDTSKYQKYQYRNCDIDAIIDAGPLYLMQQSMRSALYPMQQSMQAALYPMQQSMQGTLYPMQQSMQGTLFLMLLIHLEKV